MKIINVELRHGSDTRIRCAVCSNKISNGYVRILFGDERELFVICLNHPEYIDSKFSSSIISAGKIKSYKKYEELTCKLCGCSARGGAFFSDQAFEPRFFRYKWITLNREIWYTYEPESPRDERYRVLNDPVVELFSLWCVECLYNYLMRRDVSD